MLKKKMWLICSLLILILMLFLSILYVLIADNYLVEVPISKNLIENRTKIMLDDIVYIKVPKKMLQENIILDEKQIIGKYTLINTQIPRNSYFYQGVLEDIELSVDYPLSLLQDNQALFSLNDSDVEIGLTTLSNFHHVDIYFSAEESNVIYSDLLVRNVRVLALYDLQGNRIKKSNAKQKIYQVALAIDRDLINLLTKAKRKGKISLYQSQNKQISESVLNQNSSILSILE